MTAQEVCDKYNISESSLKKNFLRTQKSIYKKYGVRIIKEGRGSATVYEEEENDCRALTLYQETKNEIFINDDSIKLVNFDFLVFLAIITTPMMVFRGSYEEFLSYVEIKPTKQNILSLKIALQELKDRDLISYTIDKTDNDWFIAALYRKVEKEYHIGIAMIKTCKRLAQENNKREWIPLLKTWLGMQIIYDNKDQPFTMSKLCYMTGLSESQIRNSKKILEKEEIFRTNRAYIAFNRCIGSKVELNAFYNS